MNLTTRTLILAALLVVGACREGGPLGPVGPIAGGAAPGGSAAAILAALTGGTVTGAVTFTKGIGTDVTVNVTLNGCVAGKTYPVHIHQGTGCADAVAQGDHWGPTRGEMIPSVVCGATGMGTTMYTRPATDPTLAWTIGGDPATNVVGHAFIAHAPDVPMMPPRIACGVIAAK